MKKAILIFGALIAIVILVYTPVYIYRNQFDASTFSDSQADWGAFGDYWGGIINAIISVLTLLVTSSIAFILYHYEKKRDELSQTDYDVNSYKELYQFFISSDFREARVVAWYILKKGIEHDDYMDFILKENYVSRYKDRTPRADVYNVFKDILYQNDHPQLMAPSGEQAFLRQEALDRNKVDTLINFFQLLSVKKIPLNHYKICDFYYDTWRPVLYFYSERLLRAYEDLGADKRYNNPPSLNDALIKLDTVFLEQQTLEALGKENILDHPIILHMKSGKP